MSLSRRSCLVIVFLFAAAAAHAQSADLAVTKTGPALATGSGDTVSYVVTLTNNGPDTATNVVLTDEIPENMVFASRTQDSGPLFICTDPGAGNIGTVTCSIAAFPASTTAQFTFQFTIGPGVPAGSPFVNTASVTSSTTDPIGGNNSDDATTTTTAADLVVTKNGPAEADPGDDVTYVVNVTNLGPQDAANMTVNDAIPIGMSFVSANNTGGTAGSCSVDPMFAPNGRVTCTVALLPAGGSTQFTLVFNIDDEAPEGTSFTNVATATTTTGDPNSENNTGITTTTIPFPAQADLGVSKTGSSIAGPNTDVTFTITLANGGPGAAENVTLTDPLPGGLTFVSIGQSGTTLNCTTPAAGSGGTITCTAATYPAFASTGITITAHVPLQAEPEYVNTVTVSSDNDFVAENDSASTAVTVSAVDVSVLKQGPGTVNAGSNITYTLTMNNVGSDTALGVTLTDTVPAGTTFVSFVQNNGPPANCVIPSAGGSGTVNCSFEMFGGGQTAVFTLIVNATGSTATVTNTAVTDTPNNFDTDGSNDSSTVITTVTPRADLSVFKGGPATVTAGTNITYTVSVVNSGPSAAANVVLADAVPANTTFVSANQTSGPAFSCNTAIDCTIASFPAGATATFAFTFQVSPSATGSITNTAQVSSTTADPDADSTDLSATAVSTVVTSANLGVTKSGPPTAAAGSNVTFTVTASNFGPSDATNVALTDLVPAPTTYVSATQTSGPAFTCDTDIDCTIATFPAGATAAFTFVFAVPAEATGTITNTATIDSPVTDPSSGNDSSTVMTAIAPTADLSVVKNGPAAITAGATVTYDITVNNAGPSTATNVSLTDQLPPMTTFVSATQNTGPAFTCGQAGGTVTCTIATLAPSTPATFTFVFDTDPAIAGSFDNTAAVSSSTSDPSGTNNTSTVTTGIDPGPTDLSITKTADVSRAGFGQPVNYTITVTNNGPATAFGTTVTDILPAGTTFQSATPSQGSCTGTTTVTCNLGTLAPAGTATIALTILMPHDPGTVTNTATVSAANAETDPDDNSGAAALAVTAEIPTLSTYMLMLLAILLAGTALVARMK